MKKRTRVVVFCLLLLICFTGLSQNYSNKGTDFYITYPLHIDGATSVMGIYITSDKASSGTIEVGGQSIPFSLAANSVVRKFIGPGGDASNNAVYLTAQDGIVPGAAIHVISDNPVAVYAHIIKTSRSGASLIFPTSVWGKQYVVPSYANVGSQSGAAYGIAAVTVVAEEANTTVQITPTANTRSGKPAGIPFQITLANPGDVYQVQFAQSADISGTSVQSVSTGGSTCKKIAVFSSTSWSAFGCGNASSGDNLYQQLFPTASWGKSFLTSPAKTRITDIYRVFVSDPQTVVTKTENGVKTTLTGLRNNSFYEFATGNPTFIQADRPSSVVQYLTTQSCQPGAILGDPEMIVLNPVEQTINDITVFSAHKNWVPANQSAVDHCYLNIIIRTNAAQSFRINGAAPAAGFITIPGTDYSYLQEEVTAISATNPVQTLTADSSFVAIAYGFGNVESYGYNAGTNVRDFSTRPVLQTDFARIDSSVTCVNTAFQLSVPLAFQPTTIKWDFTAAPNISPSATLNPAPKQDSTVNGIYYYSPGGIFSFSKPNTAARRDTIKLYTTSATPDGCGSTDQLFSIPVKVNDLPIAKFAVANSGCVSDSVQFTDESLYAGSLVKWQWDFGDASSEARTAATAFLKKYQAAGEYTVKMKAYTDVGCVSAEVSQVLKISARPVASFSVASATLCPEADIRYTDASTSSQGTLAVWTWNLDDGAGVFSNTTNAEVKTKYADAGTRNPWLLVANSTGCKSDTFFLPAKINALPVPGFRVPEVCQNDANAKFTDTSSIAEGAIVSFAWNFNAGASPVLPPPMPALSTVQHPQPKYNKADHYKVSLTVTSDKGCVATSVQDFTVNGATPKADFVFSGTAPYCGEKEVQLINQSSVDFGSVTRLELYWNHLGAPDTKQFDEDPYGGKLYTHSYAANNSAQQYEVKLVAYSGGDACVSEVSKMVTVYPQPEALYSVSMNELCEGQTVQFTDNSRAGAATIAAWRWNLGRNNIVTQQNTSRQYNDSGSIVTNLVVTTSDGCVSDTAHQTLMVYPNPKLEMPAMIQVPEGALATVKPLTVYGKALQYLWTPVAYIVGSNTLSETKLLPPDDLMLTLQLTAEGGCSVTGGTLVKVIKALAIPNGFSPNGDGINDTWQIKYLDGYPDATIEVFDRGGRLVFRSVGYHREWDGTYNGTPLPIGTYYYIINPKTGKTGVYTGSVTILK